MDKPSWSWWLQCVQQCSLSCHIISIRCRTGGTEGQGGIPFTLPHTLDEIKARLVPLNAPPKNFRPSYGTVTVIFFLSLSGSQNIKNIGRQTHFQNHLYLSCMTYVVCGCSVKLYAKRGKFLNIIYYCHVLGRCRLWNFSCGKTKITTARSIEIVPG